MSLDEVLTIEGIDSILQMAEKAVYPMAQAGELPGFKIRGQWRGMDFGDGMERQARTLKIGLSEP